MIKHIKKWLGITKPRYKLTSVSDLQIGMRVLVPGYRKESTAVWVKLISDESVGVMFRTYNNYSRMHNGTLIASYQKSEKLWVKVSK